MYLFSGFLFFRGGSYFGYPLLPTELMILPTLTHGNTFYKSYQNVSTGVPILPARDFVAQLAGNI